MAEEQRRASGRRSTDSMDTDGLPIWAKVIGLIGVPSAIAVYLVWALVSEIAPGLVKVNNLLADHIFQMSSFISGQQELKNQNESILRVLRTSCANQSKSDRDRENCLR